MTNRRTRPSSVRTSAFLAVSITAVLACGEGPEEGEIVIRAEDLYMAEGPEEDDSLAPLAYTPASDSLSAIQPAEPSFPPTDSSEVDTAAADRSAVDSSAADSSAADSSGVEICPWTRIAVEINGSIYGSLAGLTVEPDILGAHVVRCMCWDLDPWRGVSAGDSLYLLVGETGRENRVVALRYVPVPGSPNHPFSVYSFRMTGDNFPSHYYSDGTEVMKLLSTMPVSTFEEMTGPYGEPRGDHTHSGVDFKAPLGTTVRTCRGGTVTRLNWNPEYNGNCVEIDIGAGYREIFLHLESVDGGITVGSVLARGDRVGTVGSTGVTSTAPHIHYQINDERGNPIDPYLFFGSRRRNLPQGDMAVFTAFRESCDCWLSPGTAAGAR